MKRLSIVFLLLMTTIVGIGAPVTKQQARQWAQEFMSQRGVQIVAEPRRAPGMAVDAEMQPFYVFNTVANKGFVIIAGDDCAEHVLGYVTEGSYDENNLPDNFRAWLEMMTDKIRDAERLCDEAGTLNNFGLNSSDSSLIEETMAPHHIPTHPAITPLIKTKWDQGYSTQNGYIYNEETPVIDNEHCITGCGATAGAQVMNYYQHPQKATKKVPGYTIEGSPVNNQTKVALPAYKFNWSAMKNVYTDGDTLTTSSNAVSMLMKYCGWAANMSYGLDGSYSNENIMAQNMVKYFDYDPNTLRTVSSNNYSVNEWDALIYGELSEARPIIFSGQEWHSDGHIFICDGYDGAGLYHFNWGWGGYCDGYFSLHAANCNLYGIYEDGVFASGYILDMYATIGLQPNSGAAPPSVDDIVAHVFDTSVDGKDIFMAIGNDNGQPYGFSYGLGKKASNGTFTPVWQADYSNSELSSGWYYYFNLDASTFNLANGTHSLYPISKVAGSNQWKQCTPNTLIYTVNVSGSSVTVELPKANLSITKFDFPGAKVATKIQRVVATVKSTGDEYTKPLYLFASKNKKKMGTAVYCSGTAIEANKTEDVMFCFLPETAGTYYLWVCTDEEGTDVVGTGSVAIASIPTTEVTFDVLSHDIIPRSTATVTIKVKNTSSVMYYEDLKIELYGKYDGNNYYSWIEDRIIESPLIQSGETRELTVRFSDLDVGRKYRVYWYYAPFVGDYWETLTNKTFTIVGVPTNIQQTTELDSGEWYTLDGRKLNSVPTAKGVYVKDGRKVVIK